MKFQYMVSEENTEVLFDTLRSARRYIKTTKGYANIQRWIFENDCDEPEIDDYFSEHYMDGVKY